MHAAYRYRVYPTRRQERQLARVFGSYRFVYNWALAERQREHAVNGVTVPWSEMSARLTKLKRTPEFSWLNEVAAQTLQAALADCQTAYERFFKKQSKFPRFKKKHSAASARFSNQTVRLTNRGVRLPKTLGELKTIWHRELPSDYKLNSATVSRDASGRYFISLSVETADLAVQSAQHDAVGVDLGLTALATLSTGEKLVNLRAERRDRVALVRAQRQLSRKQKGSKNREKARLRVARVHARIADRRRDHLHKFTSRLVDENQVIGLEDLNVLGMLKNSSLSRAISDASWSELRRQIEYKAAWRGREVVFVDRFYPSSKTCSSCGHLVDRLPLNVRTWTCSECLIEHDRDVNAALNLRTAALAGIACGEAVRPNARRRSGRASVKQEANQALHRERHLCLLQNNLISQYSSS